MDWGTVLSLAGLFLLGVGYLARQMKRVEDSLSKRIDQLTERLLTNLEHHPRRAGTD